MRELSDVLKARPVEHAAPVRSKADCEDFNLKPMSTLLDGSKAMLEEAVQSTHFRGVTLRVLEANVVGRTETIAGAMQSEIRDVNPNGESKAYKRPDMQKGQLAAVL